MTQALVGHLHGNKTETVPVMYVLSYFIVLAGTWCKLLLLGLIDNHKRFQDELGCACNNILSLSASKESFATIWAIIYYCYDNDGQIVAATMTSQKFWFKRIPPAKCFGKKMSCIYVT